MEKNYTKKTLSKFIKIYDQSLRMGVEKDLSDYELGKIIVMEVLLGRSRALRNERSLPNFQKDLKRHGRTVSIQTLHNYKHLFLGAHNPEHIKNQQLPREYFIRLGEICDDLSVFSIALARALRVRPILTEDGSVDEEKLSKIQEYVAPVWDKLPWNPITWDLVDQGVLRIVDDPPALHLHLTEDVPEEDLVEIFDSLDELDKMVRGIDATTGEYIPFVCLQNCNESAAEFRANAKLASLLVISTAHSGFPSPASKKDKAFSRTQKTFTLRQNWLNLKQEVMSHATPKEMQQQQERVHHGKSQQKLKNPKLFPPASVDVVITDPPYGEGVYGKASKPHLKRHIDSPDTPEEAAALAAEVAGVILDRKINKPKFVYFQFMPLNHAHVFVPPLLAEFDKRRIKYNYQLWIWDKGVGSTGTSQSAAPRCEGIAYINTGRPLTDTLNGKEVWKHNPLLEYPAVKTDKFWKPPALIEHLIRMVTYEDESKEARQQLILDPFAGRGSTGVAAIKCNRDFRLIESNHDEFEMCKTNILEALHEHKTD